MVGNSFPFAFAVTNCMALLSSLLSLLLDNSFPALSNDWRHLKYMMRLVWSSDWPLLSSFFTSSEGNISHILLFFKCSPSLLSSTLASLSRHVSNCSHKSAHAKFPCQIYILCTQHAFHMQTPSVAKCGGSGCHHHWTGNGHESFLWLACIWGIASSIHVAEADTSDAELGFSMTASGLPWEFSCGYRTTLNIGFYFLLQETQHIVMVILNNISS